MGCVSPFGSGGTDVVTTMLQDNITAIGPLMDLDTTDRSRHLGAELPATVLVPTEESRRWSRISLMAVSACRQAAREAMLDDLDILYRFGLVLGSEFGDLRSTEAFESGFLRRGQRGLSAFLFPNTVMNSMAGTVSIAMGLKGPMLTLNQTGVAGELAVARAMMLIAAGRAPAVVVCGVDELFPVLYDLLDHLNVPSPQNGAEEGCYPFDQRHNGPVLGEGATALILETLEHAQLRGAPIIAEVYSARWGALPARPHRYPESSQVVGCLLEQALMDATATAQDIQVAYLSGSGDPQHDESELALLHTAFGSHCPMVTSITHLSGEHGSLGVLRTAAAAITATSGCVPTLDYLRQPIRSDVMFALRASDSDVVSPVAAQSGLGTVMVHGLARGGVQAVIVLGPLRPEVEYNR